MTPCSRLCIVVSFFAVFAATNEAFASDVASEEPAETAASPSDKPAWKQQDWFGPWQFEVSFSGTGGFSDGGFYGGGLGLNLRHVSEFNAKSPVSLDEDLGVVLAIMTLGISAAPKGIWMGNEWGFDLRARLLQMHQRNVLPEQRLTLGIAPSFRITRPGSRLRYPAVLPTFVPELGIGLVSGRAPEFVLQFHPFSMGFLLTDHWAIELEAAAMFVIPSDDRRAEYWVVQSLSLQLR